MINLPYTQLDQYSRDLYSDDKPVRTLARQRLISLTNSFQKIPALTSAEKKSFPNWHKVSSLISGMLNEGEFPYQVDTTKAGVISGYFDLPAQPQCSHTDFESSTRPCYIVNMAHSPNLKAAEPLQKLSRQINLLWNEGFGVDTAASQAEADNRLAVVVGINYCHSLDTPTNKRNKAYLAEATTLSTSHVYMKAFCWEPVWTKNGAQVSQKKVKRLFRLLADVDQDKASSIFKRLMQNKRDIIPFQRIRNEIKNDPHVVTLLTALRRGHLDRPSFLVSWDDDAVRLRTEEIGLFSHYDQLIAQNPDVEVATTGYYLTNPNEQFVEFASRADLIARVACAHVLPNGSYLPEPNLIIKIGQGTTRLKNRISFLRSGANNGKGLESIGLLENLGLMKGDVLGRVVIGRSGPLLTTQPFRATVPSHIPKVLTPARINSAKNLASLRSFCQSSLNPKKGFAANVARAMPQGTGSQVNTAKISKLYTAFDPVEHVKTVPDWKVVYSPIIKALLDIYELRCNKPEHTINYTTRAQNIIANANLNESKKAAIVALLTNKSEDIWDARVGLVEGGPKLTEAQFGILLQTTVNTTFTVYVYLESKIDQVAFAFPNLH